MIDFRFLQFLLFLLAGTVAVFPLVVVVVVAACNRRYGHALRGHRAHSQLTVCS